MSTSILGTIILMLPVGALMGMSLFGLDARLAAPRRERSKALCGFDGEGKLVLLDPDGRQAVSLGAERQSKIQR